VSNQSTAAAGAETVLITYHVIRGKEQELRHVLDTIWNVYRKEHLVFAQPHVIVEAKDSGGKVSFVETFTWISGDAVDHAPQTVKKLWDQMQSCCETRDGQQGVSGGEVTLVLPASPVGAP
jgi:hypothetical protein